MILERIMSLHDIQQNVRKGAIYLDKFFRNHTYMMCNPAIKWYDKISINSLKDNDEHSVLGQLFSSRYMFFNHIDRNCDTVNNGFLLMDSSKKDLFNSCWADQILIRRLADKNEWKFNVSPVNDGRKKLLRVSLLKKGKWIDLGFTNNEDIDKMMLRPHDYISGKLWAEIR